jgi:hypothetical protein
MLPPAPPLLSTTKDWPKVLDSWSQISRLTPSVPPPGAKGTMKRTGLVGHAAWARPARNGAAAARLPNIKSRRFIRLVLR